MGQVVGASHEHADPKPYPVRPRLGHFAFGQEVLDAVGGRLAAHSRGSPRAEPRANVSKPDRCKPQRSTSQPTGKRRLPSTSARADVDAPLWCENVPETQMVRWSITRLARPLIEARCAGVDS